mgnify:CR=1 FL=1
MVMLLPSRPNWMFFLIAFAICVAVVCRAKAADNEPVVGRKAAEKYFQEEKKVTDETLSNSLSTAHFMAIHLGTFLSEESFAWGQTRNVKDLGQHSFGVTYRIGEWRKSMDLLFRGEWQSFELPEGDASKLSFMPVLQFPEASSGFPLYFGFGLGFGVFTKQISDESDISLDYQLLGGARWFNLYRNAGFCAEFGLKNHYHVLSSGQLNSLFLSIGSVFTF